MMLTFATKTLPTGANGQKADGTRTSPFVRAVLKKLSWIRWPAGGGISRIMCYVTELLMYHL